MSDDVERRPPRRQRDRGAPPRSTQPRLDAVLEAYESEGWRAIRKPTQAQAMQAAREIEHAVSYLNKWETDPDTGANYNVRTRPVVKEHYSWDGQEYEFYDPKRSNTGTGWGYTGTGKCQWSVDAFARMLASAIERSRAGGTKVEHYWLCHFEVHPPNPNFGFARQSPAKLADTHRRSAVSRGVRYKRPRTVLDSIPSPAPHNE